jgi:hypothetical protein
MSRLYSELKCLKKTIRNSRDSSRSHPEHGSRSYHYANSSRMQNITFGVGNLLHFRLIAHQLLRPIYWYLAGVCSLCG